MLPHKLSESSKRVYDTLHPDLQLLIDWVLGHVLVDISLVEGYRSPEKQFEYYQKGRQQNSNGEWIVVNPSKVITNIDGYNIKSNHNYNPSHAVDFRVYVSGRPDLNYSAAHIGYVAGAIISKAEELFNEGRLQYLFRWGNDWDRDGDFTDNSLVDMPHIELYGEPKSPCP